MGGRGEDPGIALLLLACGDPVPDSVRNAEAPAPDTAPTLELVDRKALQERIYATGQIHLVNLWATWCGPCKSEMPRLVEWAQAHPNVDVVLLSIDYVSERQTVQAYADAHPMIGADGLFLLDAVDPTSAITALVPGWPGVVPVTMFVNSDGSVAYTITGAAGKADLDEGLARAGG